MWAPCVKRARHQRGSEREQPTHLSEQVIRRFSVAGLDLPHDLLVHDVLEFPEGQHPGGDGVGGIGVPGRAANLGDVEFGGKLAAGGCALSVELLLSMLLGK